MTRLESSQGSGSSVPIGSIIAWPFYDNPDGADANNWLECNGQYVNPILYPKLAAKMSYTPNYNGVFLRGYGSRYSSHYGTVLHQSGPLGELQGDAIRNIVGTVGYWNDDQGTTQSGAFYLIRTGNSAHQPGGGNQWAIGFDSSRVVPTAEEDRPINVAVRWLIKAK